MLSNGLISKYYYCDLKKWAFKYIRKTLCAIGFKEFIFTIRGTMFNYIIDFCGDIFLIKYCMVYCLLCIIVLYDVN